MTPAELEEIRRNHYPYLLHDCDALDIDDQIDLERCGCVIADLCVACAKCCTDSGDLHQFCWDDHTHTANRDERCDVARLLAHIDGLNS